MPGRTVITIGNFDGVHRGHAVLAARARELAGPARHDGRVIAMVFHPHPLSVLRPDQAPVLLTTFDRRRELLLGLGVDEVIRLEPTPTLLGLAPEEFIERTVGEHRPGAFVEGPDFRFGRGRTGDVARLREAGRRLGFEVGVVEPVTAELTDQTLVTASSSLVRWLVAHGRVADAARVLGRPYELTGSVVRGDRRGREIGFPTANLDTPCLIPGDAVYAGSATLPDGRCLPAAVHIGPRATFQSVARTVEAHVLDWAGPLSEGAEEYGWELRLSLHSWLRDLARFESVAALVDQIGRDVARTREAVGGAPPCSVQLQEAGP